MGLDGNFIRGPVRIIPAKQVIGIIKRTFQRTVAMADGQQSAVLFTAQHQGVLLCGKCQRRRELLHRGRRRLLGAAWSRRKEKMRGAGIAKKLASCNSSSCQWAIKTMQYAFFS